jgi:hypothetical protein
MKKQIFLCMIAVAILLLVTLMAGCQQQPEGSSGHLTLQITSPKDGRETSWGFVTVDGVVSPPEAVVTVNGVGVTVDENGRFESDYILLDEGKNELTAIATLDGEKVSKTVSVNYNLKLHVSLSLPLEPAEDYITESPAEFRGRVSDPRAEVTINERRAEVGKDGFFSVMLELEEGRNSFTTTARLGDQADSETREAIYLPPSPLTLNIVAPPDGHEIEVDLVKVRGTVSDPAAKVLVDNIPAQVTAGGSFYAYVELDGGKNRIDAVASRNGKSVAETIHVTYSPPAATPPGELALEITSPRNGIEQNVNLLPVTGTVSEPSAAVVVNGLEAMVAEDGSFQGYAVLNKGENNIKVIAIKDTIKTAKNIPVTFTPALVVLLEHPSLDWTTDYTREPMTVTGKVNKPEASVTVNGQEVAVAPDGSFTAQVKLQEGSSSIKAIATLGDERDEIYLSFMVEDGHPNPVPGYSHFFDAQLRCPDEVTLKAGETEWLDVTLDMKKDGPGRFYGKITRGDEVESRAEFVLPEGLDVYLEPPEFMAYPNTVYNFNLVIETTPGLAPGTYYLEFYRHLENGFYGSGWIVVTME